MLFPGVLIKCSLACQCRLCEQQVSYRLIAVNNMLSSLAASLEDRPNFSLCCSSKNNGCWRYQVILRHSTDLRTRSPHSLMVIEACPICFDHGSITGYVLLINGCTTCVTSCKKFHKGRLIYNPLPLGPVTSLFCSLLTSEEDVLVEVRSRLSGRNVLSSLSQGASMELILVSSVSDATAELGFPDFEWKNKTVKSNSK